MVRAFIGLGSNVGDRVANLRRAIEELRSHEGVEVVRTSSAYDTDAVGPPQPNFLNAVAEIRTSLGATELMLALKSIERALGRLARERWGPREIDLDLLLYGEETIDDAELRVPHPELPRRAFVLVPLAEIAPDELVPGAGPIREVADRVDDAGVRLIAGPEALGAT